jgi:hypothetical protein
MCTNQLPVGNSTYFLPFSFMFIYFAHIYSLFRNFIFPFFTFVYHLSFLSSFLPVSTLTTFVSLVLVCAYVSYIYVCTHTHTHTHIHIYVCVCVCVFAWLGRSKLVGIHASVCMSLCFIYLFTYRLYASLPYISVYIPNQGTCTYTCKSFLFKVRVSLLHYLFLRLWTNVPNWRHVDDF